MCGIVAIISGRQAIDPQLLSAMRDALAHRGPDAATQWMDGGVGLAHRRLAVIDTTEGGAQPMHGEDGALVLVFNGEIYNYLELREQLRAKGRVFHTQSDTEVLLQALAEWGEDALPRLNGMFAFALWNRRTRQLLVARDRFGEKPLFLTHLPEGGVAVASEIKALLRNPSVSDETDPQTLSQYTGAAYNEDGDNTLFRAIRRHPAASASVYDEQGQMLRRWRYWTPDYMAIDERISEDDAVERFQELFERSIRMRLRADVKIGSSLSGGLDSSIIVGLIAGERNRGSNFAQDTFSACFPDDPTMSEGAFIDDVVAMTGVKSHVVSPDPLKLIEESRALHWHQEEPFLSASIYLQWCVARLAKENGAIVQLDGQGADELLGGYQYWFKSHQTDLLDQGRFDEAISTTRAFTARLQAAASLYADSSRRFNAATAYTEAELEAMKGETQWLYKGPWQDGLPPALPGLRVRRLMAESVQYNSLPMLLRYADRNSMAFSREARLPFLDYDLADFCISLPDRHFFHDGWQKNILRRAAEGHVPDSVRWRADKVGYAAPLDLWMRGSMKDWCYERVFEGEVTRLPNYDGPALKALWDQHQAGAANNSWSMWRWISLSEWMDVGRDGGWRRGPNDAPPPRAPSVTSQPPEAAEGSTRTAAPPEPMAAAAPAAPAGLVGSVRRLWSGILRGR